MNNSVLPPTLEIQTTDIANDAGFQSLLITVTLDADPLISTTFTVNLNVYCQVVSLTPQVTQIIYTVGDPLLSVPLQSFSVDPAICVPYSVLWTSVSPLPPTLVTENVAARTLDVQSFSLADVGVY